MSEAVTYEPHMAVPDDLAGMASRYRRHLPLIVLVTLLSVAAAGAVTFLQKPRYRATALVQFQPTQNSLIAPDPRSNQPPIQQTPEQVIETQEAILESPSLASGVIDRLGLMQDPEYNTLLKAKATSGMPRTPEQIRLATLNRVEGGLHAKRVGLTSVFKIGFDSQDPVKAARIANAFAETYIQQGFERKREQIRGGGDLMSGELQTLRAQADAADRAVQNYKISNGLVSSSGVTLAEQEISALNGQAATARAEEAEALARLNAARRQAASRSGGEDVAAALDSPTIQRLREQRSQASALLAQLTSRYGERYPEVIKARQAVGDVDVAIKQEVGRVLSNLEAQADIARERRNSVERSLGGARGALTSNAAATVGLGDLQRTADAAKEQYETFLTRSRQTSAQQTTVQPDAQITSLANAPLKANSPNPPMNLLLGLVFGLSLGVGLAFVRHQWTLGLDTLDDVERQLGQAYFGSLPTVKSSVKKPGRKNPIDQVVGSPFSRYAEAFRNLGASALYSPEPGGVKVLGVTSALPQEGKTTSSVCLGRVLAMGRSRVMMIDCDLRRRSLTEALQQNAAIGLIEVLEGRATLEEATVVDEQTGAHVLPLAANAQLAKAPFASEAFDTLLARLRENYDVIILDTAPVLAVADTRVLAPKVDALIMLVRWRETPAKAARAAIQMLESVGARVTGVSLSLVNLKAQAQSRYGDAGTYYAKVASYYAS